MYYLWWNIRKRGGVYEFAGTRGISRRESVFGRNRVKKFQILWDIQLESHLGGPPMLRPSCKRTMLHEHTRTNR
jgi:hypothetical protein